MLEVRRPADPILTGNSATEVYRGGARNFVQRMNEAMDGAHHMRRHCHTTYHGIAVGWSFVANHVDPRQRVPSRVVCVSAPPAAREGAHEAANRQVAKHSLWSAIMISFWASQYKAQPAHNSWMWWRNPCCAVLNSKVERIKGALRCRKVGCRHLAWQHFTIKGQHFTAKLQGTGRRPRRTAVRKEHGRGGPSVGPLSAGPSA